MTARIPRKTGTGEAKGGRYQLNVKQISGLRYGLPARSCDTLFRIGQRLGKLTTMNTIKCLSAVSRLLVAAMAALAAAPASAGMDLRVESRPMEGEIEAYVRVTNEDGQPIRRLENDDFTVRLDDAPLNIGTFGSPLALDAAQKKSIVFVAGPLIPSSLLHAMVRFVRHMEIGEYEAIVRLDPDGIRSVPFTQIDGGAGTDLLVEELRTPIDRPPGRFGYIFNIDNLMHAVKQFATPPVALPNGPKAIVLVQSRYSITISPPSRSQSDVVAYANAVGVPISTLGFMGNAQLLTSLADATGGNYIPGDPDDPDHSFAEVSSLLNDAYRLTFPPATIANCDPHVLEVSVAGQSASIPFARCDTTPEPFEFEPVIGATPGSFVTSNAVTIAGIESLVAIEVIRGSYSIGCGATFTSVTGFLYPGDNVCVRHTAATDFLTLRTTTLVVGGVAAGFSSETSTAPTPPVPEPPPPARPKPLVTGGGATGVIELLLGLGLLLAGRLLLQSGGSRHVH